MSDENALLRQVERGHDAKRIIDHPITGEVIERLVRDTMAGLASVEPGDLAAFQACQARLKVAQSFKDLFRAVVKEGQDAEAILKNMDKQRTV